MDRVHRVVPADHEQVADVVLSQGREDRFEVAFLELVPARAQRAARRGSQLFQTRSVQGSKVEKEIAEDTFDPETHAENAKNCCGFFNTCRDAGQGSIYNRSWPTGLPDEAVAANHGFFLKSG